MVPHAVHAFNRRAIRENFERTEDLHVWLLEHRRCQ